MSNETDTNTAKRSASGPGFDLRLSDDFMAVLLSCTLPPRNPELILTRVRAELGDLGFQEESRIDEATARLTKAFPHGPNLEDIVLLEGTPPKPPVDESVSWKGNFHAKGFVIDPDTGKANYRRKIADISVESNQLLAEITAGIVGQNGYDVFGRLVPPRAPRPATIRQGKNVRFEPGSRQFFAEKSGRFRFADDILTVDEVYHISGDAGLKTGNIDHPGTLIVEGDIQSGTEVRATGDIDVGENIEDVSLESGGNLTVHGGISCKVRGVIKVAGNLHARYIRNADIDAHGDIFVDSEVNQCHIRTRGSVIIKQGRIVGGSIIALKGIESHDLGSDACIPGEYIVGKDFTMESTVSEKKKELDSSRDLVMKLRQTVAPLRAKRDSLTPKLEEQLVQFLDELQKREKTFKKQEKALNDIFRATKNAAVPHIYVHGTLHPDNQIQLSAQIKKIQETVPGPLRLSLRKGKFGLFKLKGGESLQDRIQPTATRPKSGNKR